MQGSAPPANPNSTMRMCLFCLTSVWICFEWKNTGHHNNIHRPLIRRHIAWISPVYLYFQCFIHKILLRSFSFSLDHHQAVLHRRSYSTSSKLCTPFLQGFYLLLLVNKLGNQSRVISHFCELCQYTDVYSLLVGKPAWSREEKSELGIFSPLQFAISLLLIISLFYIIMYVSVFLCQSSRCKMSNQKNLVRYSYLNLCCRKNNR